MTARYRLFDDQQVVLGSFPVPIKVEGSRVTVANLNVLGSYTLSPTLKFDFKGGPSLIRTAPGKIPGIPSDAPNNDFTYFASLSLVRDFRESNLGLSYERSEDASGGLNRTSITEAVTLRFSRRLGEDWDFSGDVGWSRRTAVDAFFVPDPSTGALVPISRESQLDRAWLLTKATHRLSKKLRLTLTFRYQRWIEYSIAGVKQPEQENVSGALQIRYSFEPYVY